MIPTFVSYEKVVSRFRSDRKQNNLDGVGLGSIDEGLSVSGRGQSAEGDVLLVRPLHDVPQLGAAPTRGWGRSIQGFVGRKVYERDVDLLAWIGSDDPRMEFGTASVPIIDQR